MPCRTWLLGVSIPSSIADRRWYIPDGSELAKEVEELLWSNVVAIIHQHMPYPDHSLAFHPISREVSTNLRFLTNKALRQVSTRSLLRIAIQYIPIDLGCKFTASTHSLATGILIVSL